MALEGRAQNQLLRAPAEPRPSLEEALVPGETAALFLWLRGDVGAGTGRLDTAGRPRSKLPNRFSRDLTVKAVTQSTPTPRALGIEDIKQIEAETLTINLGRNLHCLSRRTSECRLR